MRSGKISLSLYVYIFNRCVSNGLPCLHINVQGTVLLNANVAFLSIQSVDNGGDVTPHRSAAQIVSYVSIVTSLGSTILSLLLVRQNRSKGRDAGDKVAEFLGNMTHGTRGLEHLAILYALPYALLMWSTLTFLFAFALDCFVTSDTLTRIPVGSMLGICTVLVFWCILAAWICESDRPHRLGEMRKRLQNRALSIVSRFPGMGYLRDGDEDGEDGENGENRETQKGSDEKKHSEETAVGTPPEITPNGTVLTTPKNGLRKQSRSRSWLPGIFVRGPTIDDVVPEAPHELEMSQV